MKLLYEAQLKNISNIISGGKSSEFMNNVKEEAPLCMYI